MAVRSSMRTTAGVVVSSVTSSPPLGAALPNSVELVNIYSLAGSRCACRYERNDGPIQLLGSPPSSAVGWLRLTRDRRSFAGRSRLHHIADRPHSPAGSWLRFLVAAFPGCVAGRGTAAPAFGYGALHVMARRAVQDVPDGSGPHALM